MFRGTDPTLISSLAHPEWLALLPLALLPFVRERLRPIFPGVVAAGWQAEPERFPVLSRTRRWLVPALLSAGASCLILALAAPARPEIPPFKPTPIGHFWAVLLDCSGSMATVDPGRQASRLRLLADDLADVIVDRPQDRFAVVRVAGYADRVGPAESSSRFLVDRLRQIAPALPGEDGTNLGDGLVLAADALPQDLAPEAKSILIVSDGRENPPDAKSFRLSDVASRMRKSGIRIDWLRLAIPSTTDESPESKALGDASKLALETLVRESGGSVIDGGPGGGRSAIVEAAIARLAGMRPPVTNWPSASTALVIATFAFWIIAWILSVSRSIRNRPIDGAAIIRGTFLALATGTAGLAAIAAVRASQMPSASSSKPTSRWLILLDTSPSMAATDASGGSRVAAASRVAQGLIGRLSVDSGARAAIVRFSGRAVPQSGWSDDWEALESIIEETDSHAIRPTGSDWDAALRTSLAFETDQDGESSLQVDTHLIVLTDGEASREPGEDVIDTISKRNWRTTFVTFGDDTLPGATFPGASDTNSPWIDHRTGKPARSARNDTLAKRVAQKTGGRVLSVGPAPFDPWNLAESIAGPLELPTRKSTAIAISRSEPFRSALASLASFLIAEVAGFRSFRSSGRTRSHFDKASILLLACISMSCAQRDLAGEFESFTESAWAAYHSGNLIQARATLELAARRLPDEAVIPYDLALIELGRNQPNRALESLAESSLRLENGTSAPPQHKRTLQARIEAARGYSLILLGRPEEAGEALKKAIASRGLSDAERADAETNAKYATAVAKPAERPKATEPETTGRERFVPGLTIEPKETIWNRMADDVRSRARAARSRFEPAGDELKSGTGILPGEALTIDW